MSNKKKQTKKKGRTLKTYVVTETIVISQVISAQSKQQALFNYSEMMDDPEVRHILTCDGCTSTSSTQTDVVVRTSEEHDIFQYSE
jgi:hypothetical protein